VNRIDLPRDVRFYSAGSARDREASLFRRRVFAGCVHSQQSARTCACVQGHGRPQNSIFSLICQAVTAKRNSRSLFRAAAANSRQPSGFFRFAFYDRARESPGGREGIAKSTRKIDELAFAIANPSTNSAVTKALRDDSKRDRRSEKNESPARGDHPPMTPTQGGFSTRFP